jgi:hypothetical protein
MATKIDEAKASRAERWAKYREYLDGLQDHLTADSDLKPGSRAFTKLKELSDRLAEVQENDFQAKQLKQEIDRALASAGGAAGGLIEAFKGMTSRDRDEFE